MVNNIMLDPNNITFRCDACRKERPMLKLDVITKDCSAEINMPIGTITHNIKYCKDDEKCVKWAYSKANANKDTQPILAIDTWGKFP